MEKLLEFITSKKFYLPIIYIIIGVVIYYIVVGIINRTSKIKLKNSKKQVEQRKITIVNLIKNIIKYLITIFVILAILSVYGVNTTNIIASLGIVGVVVGLAFQDIIKDFLAGIFIIFDNKYTIGDIVSINGFKGEVIALGLKTTKIKAYTGEILSLNNSSFTEVINYSQSLNKYILTIGVSYDTNIDKLERVLEKLVPKIEELEEVKNEVVLLGVEELSTSSINYSIMFECLPLKCLPVKRKVLKMIKEELDNNKIEIPYNKLDVYLKGDKNEK